MLVSFNRRFGGTLILMLVFTAFVPQEAAAIPSPELIIGSVSSVGQIFALLAAMLGGGAAFAGRRLGRRAAQKQSRYVSLALWVFALVAFGSLALNTWQYQNTRTDVRDRLQATLVRPAQLDGTKIKDENLKETSFSEQVSSGLAVSTQEAERLLQDTAQAVFIDVRESAENQMGTLPGSRHIRFPDLETSDAQLAGKQVVLFCHNGNRSSETCARLAALGIDCRFIAGGIEKWIVEGRPFTDESVRSLADLRAIPTYQNKDTLLNTQNVHDLVANVDAQFVDARYPVDFKGGHLPGASNIPLRALRSEILHAKIIALQNKPVIAACYDRRSCFISQVLGLELTQAGFDFQGRYTVPWEYFEAKPVKPHVAAWLEHSNASYWQKSVQLLPGMLVWMAGYLPPVLVVLLLAIVSRVLILPIAVKAERDQISSNRNKPELDAIKKTLATDPPRKLKAIKEFYRRHGMTPGRNLLALLFLPVTMLGLSAVEKTAPLVNSAILAAPDPTYLAPVLFAILGGVYIHWSLVKTQRAVWMCWILGAPLLFILVMGLTMLSTVYLCFALLFLLVQRAFVTGLGSRLAVHALRSLDFLRICIFHRGIIPLRNSGHLTKAGNKALRLSLLLEAGVPVPDGVVLNDRFLNWFQNANEKTRQNAVRKIVETLGGSPMAVRSSASAEDGAAQSFAGVYDSELDVVQETLGSSIDRIMASFSADRVASYAEVQDNKPNILVQQMVPACHAGVLFTCDPAAPGMMLGEYSEGNAEDLVSGRVTPQSFHYPRGGGSPSAPEFPFDVRKLHQIACDAEKMFGAPQDIEWASNKSEVWIVQSRDITTLDSGNSEDRTRQHHWLNLTRRFEDCPAETLVLEMDEMSEVLPRPTPLSLSYMQEIWSPGGSVDLACRSLGLDYKVSEADSSHLITVFGRLYTDCKARNRSAVTLTKSAIRRIEKGADAMVADFAEGFLPPYLDQITHWDARDFTALPQRLLLQELADIYDSFVHDTHCEIERINIVASYFSQSRESDQPDTISELGLKSISASGLYQEAVARGKEDPKGWVQQQMAHRAVFDYELSEPRYSEIPAALDALLEGLAALPSPVRQNADRSETALTRYVAFQNLKEEAKHQALKHLAVLRRALQALDSHLDGEGLVFYLTFAEILAEDFVPQQLVNVARHRRTESRILSKTEPLPPRITRLELELASGPEQDGKKGSDSGRGTWVSGQGPVVGRAFVATLQQAETGEPLDGFEKGDVLVCPMIHPAWLPHVVAASAVVSQVGGALSHMAIVARENQIPLLVGVAADPALTSGQWINVDINGFSDPEQAGRVVHVAE